MKMTLNEIKTKVPELQINIEKLVKDNENDTNRLSDIENDINVISIELEDAEDEKKRCQNFIDNYAENTNQKLQPIVDEKKKRIRELDNTIEGIKAALRQKEDERDDIKKPDTDYSKRASKIEELQKELNGICDILVQDPTINYHMQTAIMDKFDNEVQNETAEKEKSEKSNEDIKKALKDATKNGLKRTLEDLKDGKDKYNAALGDDSIDSTVAYKKYKDAKKKLEEDVKNNFAVDLKPEDIAYILSEFEKGNLDSLKIPSLEKIAERSDAVIKKLEESKKTTLDRLESKKVIPDVQETQEMKDNQKDIDGINSELAGLTTEIDNMDKKLEKLDDSIKDKKDKLGKPSDDYKEFKNAEQNLKDKHLIVDDMVPDLKDSDSDLSKKYKKFEDADLAVRKAFQECKVKEKEEDRKQALADLKQAIDSYKTVSKELEDLSGFDIESWQNYLKEDLNSRAMKRETLDSAYFHTNNQRFKDMKDDKDILNDGDAINEYTEVETSLKQLDDAQTSVLNGNNIAIEDLYKGYYGKLDAFQDASGLEKGENNASIPYLLDLKNKSLIKRRPINRVKNFFKRIGQKIKPKKPFKITEENKEAIAEYKNARTENDELENEIKDRNELENLISKRDALKSQRDAKFVEKNKKEDALTKAKEKQNDLAKNAAKNAQSTSKIEAAETDFRKVTYNDDIIKAAVKREEEKAKEDEGR